MNYHNCSCPHSGANPKPSEDLSDEPRSHGRHANAHFAYCQSLPVSYNHGMQNRCDVCRECYETCSCVGNTFPLRTFSVSRGFALPRNSCLSLRRNSYERNALSVCCSDAKAPRMHLLLSFGKTTGYFYLCHYASHIIKDCTEGSQRCRNL